MTKQYDTLVLIGRFQPVHNAHVEIIRRASALAKQLIIIVGSAKQPRTYKNPWTSHERILMLNNIVNLYIPKDSNIAVRIEENIDTIYNNAAWAGRVQSIVAKYTDPKDKIAIIGHEKDDSTKSYLNMFPQWGKVHVESIQPLNATDVRDLYFRRDVNMNFIHGVVPQVILRTMEGWKNTPDYQQIINEREFIVENKKQYAGLKYEPTFNTGDAAVFCSGHILMIRRRAEPGKGLWALPGGYLMAGKDNSLQDCAIRELREETKIKVPVPVLVGSIKASKIFDAIDRSPRGRIITNCFKIVLPDGELPVIKGSDDAEKAKWIPIGAVDPETCFEDHYEIIQWALGA